MPLRKAYAGEGRLPPIIPAARGARRTTPAGSETEARVEEARMRSAALLADRLQSVRHRLCDGGGARAEVAHQLERIYEHSAADVDGLRGEARESRATSPSEVRSTACCWRSRAESHSWTCEYDGRSRSSRSN